MLTPLVRYLTLAALCGAPASAAFAQVSASDLLVRLEQIEAHVRQLTGQIEQLQFRNQQLDQQV
ncbi:MAG TPA: tol-pal system protein YbgF, partial [Xanthobacteraceae bacterium]